MIRANVRALWSANKQATKCMTFDRNQSSHSIRIFREQQQQQRPQDTRHTRYSHVRVCNQIVLTKFPVNQAPDMSSVCANIARRAKTPLSRAHNVIYVPSSISFPYYVTIEPKMTDKFVNVFGCTLPVCVGVLVTLSIRSSSITSHISLRSIELNSIIIPSECLCAALLIRRRRRPRYDGDGTEANEIISPNIPSTNKCTGCFSLGNHYFDSLVELLQCTRECTQNNVVILSRIEDWWGHIGNFVFIP